MRRLIEAFCFFCLLVKGTGLFVSDVRSAIHHLNAKPPSESMESLANTKIRRRDGGEILAFATKPPTDHPSPTLILIHEFFGLTKSICDKADALAKDVGCNVIAPDTFRGESSTFIPKCIFLAATTPQDRVNRDIDDVLSWASGQVRYDTSNLAVMGFCYGGGKAIRYTTEQRPDAATVVCYGSPVTDVVALSKLKGPVCGVFGSRDVQFPQPLLDRFQNALAQANVVANVRVYDGVGHAFWADMDQVRRGDEPQASAYSQVTTFLKQNLFQ